jgi:phage terminase small subunit
MKPHEAKAVETMPKRGKAGSSTLSAGVRRQLFAEAYLCNGNNATNAALIAGFSEKSAASQGARLLKHAKVKQLLEKRQAEVLDNLKITTERITLERARLAFFDPRKLFDRDGKPIPIHELDDDTAAVICGFRVSQTGGGEDQVTTIKDYKLASKDASLTSLEKQRGMYKDTEPEEIDRPKTGRDMIEAARAIAFVLARASQRIEQERLRNGRG